MGLWQRLLGKPSRTEKQLEGRGQGAPRGDDFWERAPAFCFALFRGDARDALPSLLARAGYTVVRTRQGTGSFGGLIAQVSEPGDEPDLVHKAWFVADGMTVLVDPEMIVATDEELLADFCREHGMQAATALWERVSETVQMLELSGEGVTRRSFWSGHRPDPTQQAPRPELTHRPDARGLLEALREAGFAPPAFEQRVEATVVTLQDSEPGSGTA